MRPQLLDAPSGVNFKEERGSFFLKKSFVVNFARDSVGCGFLSKMLDALKAISRANS